MHVDYIGVEKGWAKVGGKCHYFKSKFERRWAEYLEFLMQAGEVIRWQYEPIEFWFAPIKRGTRSYKPDFLVATNEDGKARFFWHECKGYLAQKDITKFRRMAKYHSDQEIILVMMQLTGKRNKPLLDKAAKYVHRIIDGGKILRGLGL